MLIFPVSFLKESEKKPFTPEDVSNLFTWIDPTDSGTITESAGLISQINDKSQNANNFFQTNNNNKMLYDLNGINGLASLNCDGNDYMATNSFSLAQPVTSFMIFQKTLNSQATLFSDNVDLVPNFESRAGDHIMYAGIGIGITGAATLNKPNLITAVFDTTNSKLRFNQTEQIGNVGTGAFSTGFTIGARSTQTEGLTGLIGEFIVYNKVLNNDEINQVETYLLDKWL